MDADGKIDQSVLHKSMAALTEGKAKSMQKYWKNLLEDTIVTNVTVKMRDGHETEMRIVTPKDAPMGHMPVYYG